MTARSGHRRTWIAWVGAQGLVGEAAARMVDALSVAAPQGPRGVRCMDSCCCGDLLEVPRLYQLLIEGAYEATEGLASRLCAALVQDRDAGAPRMDYADAQNLAKYAMVIPEKFFPVAAARRTWPKVWEEIYRGVRLVQAARDAGQEVNPPRTWKERVHVRIAAGETPEDWKEEAR